jgi:hypothetical protein
MKSRDDRPHIYHDIYELQEVAESNWNNPSVLFEVFSELQFRRPRKRPRELRQAIQDRILEVLPSFCFRWPSTSAIGGDGNLAGSGWPRTGLLSYLGYHVGTSGLPTHERRKILDLAYTDNLPTVNNPIYMANWGLPRSGPRLQKIAESLAAFCRNRKRQES